jgi:hypothetical protein
MVAGFFDVLGNMNKNAKKFQWESVKKRKTVFEIDYNFA